MNNKGYFKIHCSAISLPFCFKVKQSWTTFCRNVVQTEMIGYNSSDVYGVNNSIMLAAIFIMTIFGNPNKTMANYDSHSQCLYNMT